MAQLKGVLTGPGCLCNLSSVKYVPESKMYELMQVCSACAPNKKVHFSDMPSVPASVPLPVTVQII